MTTFPVGGIVWCFDAGHDRGTQRDAMAPRCYQGPRGNGRPRGASLTGFPPCLGGRSRLRSRLSLCEPPWSVSSGTVDP